MWLPNSLSVKNVPVMPHLSILRGRGTRTLLYCLLKYREYVNEKWIIFFNFIDGVCPLSIADVTWHLQNRLTKTLMRIASC
jgi:hypothetical protein